MPKIKALAIGDNRINLISREETEQKDTELQAQIGDLATLKTTAKDSTVNAVNELNAKRVEHITLDEYNAKVQDDSLETDITYFVHSDNLKPTQAQYNDLLNIIYPVGSIYLSMDDNFIPSTAFGGQWEKIQTGRYLQATDTGSGDLVAESLPNITGFLDFGGNLGFDAVTSCGGAFTANGKMNWRATTQNVSINGAVKDARFNASTSNSTYQDGAKVQPDSIKVIMWKRVK